MKKQLLLLLTTIFSLSCYAQITFENGYFIDNENKKTTCLIKNIDWKNNPTEIRYKLSENGETQIADVKSVKEFGVGNISKYLRATVNIDRSSDVISDLSEKKEPVFNEEVIFLKVLVEGKANLYLYEDGNLVRYFYNKADSPIEQLVYKRYKTPQNKIGKNNRFKHQLWTDLKCSTFKINKVQKLEYRKNELVDLFVAYNECNGVAYVNYDVKQKRDLFNLNLRPGLNFSMLSIQNSVSDEHFDFGNELTFSFGIEAEFIMPFNKNKWSLIFEPTYQYFNSEADHDTLIVADYKSIEILTGIRHYFFLNENSKIFINGSLMFDISMDSVIDFESATDLEIKSRNNVVFGLGYKYKDRYSLELRYKTKHLLGEYFFWSSNHKIFSVIFGYSLF